MRAAKVDLPPFYRHLSVCPPPPPPLDSVSYPLYPPPPPSPPRLPLGTLQTWTAEKAVHQKKKKRGSCCVFVCGESSLVTMLALLLCPFHPSPPCDSYFGIFLPPPPSCFRLLLDPPLVCTAQKNGQINLLGGFPLIGRGRSRYASRQEKLFVFLSAII